MPLSKVQLMVPPGGPDTIGAVTTPASSGLNRTAAGDLSVAPATNSTIGGIIVGENLTITAEGVLSASGGGGSADQVIINPIPGIDTATDVQDALEAIELQVQDRIEFCNVVGGGITPSISAPVRTSNDGTTLTLTVLGANLTRAGIVQLTNDTTGNSETLAVTQKGVAALDGKIDALVGANVLAGTYNSATGVVASTTPAGSAYLTVGSQAPAASALPDNYYLLVTVGGSLGPPGATIPPTGVQSGDWFVVEKEPGVAAAWVTIDFENAQIAALNVSVTPISGLSATNVQAGLQEINTKAQNSFTNITATAADGITVTNTAASATGRTANITLGPATTTDLGGVFVQPNNGITLGANGSIVLTPATNTTIGGVKVGSGLSVTADGTISVTGQGQNVTKLVAGTNITLNPPDGTGVVTINSAGGQGGEADSIIVNPIPGIDAANNVQEALEAIELQAQDRIEFCDVNGGGITATVSAPVLTSNDGTTLTLDVATADVGVKGMVTLTNDVTGNSTTLAPTQFAVAGLNNKIEALTGSNVLAGTYSASRGVVTTVTPAGSQYLTVGQPAPAASNLPDNYYLLVTQAGSFGPPGAVIPAAGVQSGDWFVVEKETGQPAVWVTIDFENEAVAAIQVTLSPVPGLSATNVQTGIEQLAIKNTSAFTDIEAPASNGLLITNTAPSTTGRTSTIQLLPATQTDLGGIFVQDDLGLLLGGDGSLRSAIASKTVLGSVKIGVGLSVGPDGTISVTGEGENVTKIVAGENITISPPDGTGIVTINSGGGGGGVARDIVTSPISGIDTANNVQEALEAIELQVQDRVEFCTISGGGITAAISAPVLSSNDGTTLTLTTANAGVGVKGMVTLTNDITGTSETLAPTQKAIAALDSKIDALVGANVLAGTYNSATGRVVSVTPAGSSYLVVGQQAPVADSLPDNYYLLVVVAGSFGPPGATIPPTGVQSGDWFVVEKEQGSPAAWVTIDFENNAVAAVNVSVSAISGLSATNVQTALEQLEVKAEKSFTDVVATAADGIRVTNSPTSANGRTANISLAPATATDLGGVFVQPDQGIDLGINGSLNLTPATRTRIGGVKVGSGLSVTADGTISSNGGGGGEASDVIINPISGIDTANNVQEALEAIELQVQDRIEFCSVVGGGMTASVSTPVRTSNDGTTLTLTTANAGVGTKGMVTLTNDLTGSSETLAITQKAAAALDGKIDALVGANVLAGTYNSSTGVVSSVTPAGSSYLTVGSQAPVASNLPDNYYLLVTVAGVKGPPGAVIPATGVQSGDWFVVEKEVGQPAAWVTIDFENNAVAAVNVSVSSISGLSATNVQTALQQLETKAENSFTNITATAADGIRVTNTAVSANGRTANITLAPATATDLGGVFVQPGQGIDLGANGSINLTIATASKLGGIKVGTGLGVKLDGTLYVTVPSGTVTSVGVSGGSTGLNFSNSPVTSSGTMTMSGVLSVANGGTGATSQAAAASAILPSQTGNSGKVLSTNGTSVIWVTPATGSVTSVNASGGSTGLSFSGGPITSSGTLTLAGTLAIANGGTGQTTAQNARNALMPAQTNNSGKFLTTDGTNMSWAAVPPGTITGVTAGTGLSGGGTSGTVTLNNTGVLSNVAGAGISVSGGTGNVTITNTGVRTLTAGAGISVSSSTGTPTIANTGVTSVAGSNGLSVSKSTGAVTFNFNIANLPALP